MKKNIWIMILLLIIGVAIGQFYFYQGPAQPSQASQMKKAQYHCPMHPNYTSDKPGECPICGMSLVKTELKKGSSTNNNVAGIHVNPQQQQLIGVKTGVVQTRDLVLEIRASGRVAFDPDLYVAQTGYIEALKSSTAAENSSEASLQVQSKTLLESSRRKLYLQGMSDAEIDELGKTGHADDSLYYPKKSSSVWVYAAIYEDEVAAVRPGQVVMFETPAFPGKVFHGSVFGASPVLDVLSRTIRVRVKVGDKDKLLRPETFGTATISVDLGKKLAVDQDAVLDSGDRQIVHVVYDDVFELKEVTLGTKAKGYYEVISGLKEGDKVVVSGNFLIDAESRLEGAGK